MIGEKDQISDLNIPKTFFNFIRWSFKDHKLWMLLFLLTTVLLGINSPINAFLLRYIIDTLNKFDNFNFTFQTIFFPILFFVLNDILHNLSWRIITFVQIKVAPVVKNKIISNLFDYVHQHSVKFFQENLSGSISNKIHVLAENIDQLTQTATIAIIYGTIQCGVAIITMMFINPTFSVALFIWTVVFISTYVFFSENVRHLSDAYAKANSTVSGKIVDSLTNSENVRIFSRNKFEIKYLSKFLNNLSNRYKDKKFFAIKLEGVLGLSISILLTFIIYYLFYMRSKNQITIGDLAFVLTLVTTVTEVVWWMSEQLSSINDSIGKCNQSLRTLLTEIEIKDDPKASELTITKGQIRFDKAKFEFGEGDKKFDYDCLIKSGEKVGLVGFSGSGKSTFTKLLLRIFEVKSGNIYIDDQDISKVTQVSLRRNIGMIPQDSNLFNRTIKENIAYGKDDTSDEEIVEAAKRAHVDEFVTDLAEGYDTVIGERGTKISGGQRQRISIARAILKNAPILILDEATSALDSVTERMIQDSLDFLMKDKTTIVIAHRLSTLLNMDRILVFSEGKIVEDGSHKDLLKRNGEYTKLWNEQMGGFYKK